MQKNEKVGGYFGEGFVTLRVNVYIYPRCIKMVSVGNGKKTNTFAQVE